MVRGVGDVELGDMSERRRVIGGWWAVKELTADVYAYIIILAAGMKIPLS